MAEEKTTHMSPQELIARAREERAGFTALWQDLSEEQLEQRHGPQEDWSVKDLMAHIAWWEKHAMGRVAGLLAGGQDLVTPDFDAFNAEIFEQHKDLPYGVVLDEYNTSFVHLEAQVGELNEEQLNDDGRYPTRAGSLLNLYIGNTFGHYAMHRPDVERYIASLE